MKKNLTVLITSVGGLTSPDIILVYKENRERTIRIIGVDAFQFPSGLSFVDCFYKVPSSETNRQSFVEAIEKIVLKEGVDVVIPCGNEDNLSLSQYRSNIESVACVTL